MHIVRFPSGDHKEYLRNPNWNQEFLIAACTLVAVLVWAFMLYITLTIRVRSLLPVVASARRNAAYD
jgi:hypothetical protein